MGLKFSNNENFQWLNFRPTVKHLIQLLNHYNWILCLKWPIQKDTNQW